MIGLQRRHVRNRRKNGLNTPPASTDATVTPTVSTVTVTLTYNMPVVMNDVPNFAVATRTIIAHVQTSPQVITLTLSGSGAGLAWVQSNRDPAVRTLTGGYVAAKAGTFP